MKLFKHQLEALNIAKTQNLAMFHDCGCGKTRTALEVINAFMANPDKYCQALVVCPLSIIEAAWIEDCKKFTPHLDIVSLWSKKSADRKKRLAEEHDIYVANFETFKLLYNDIVAKRFGIIIVDESSKMKDFSSQTTKALLSFAGINSKKSQFKSDYIIPHRYVLSGTPAPNDMDEYWSQIKFITGAGNDVFNDNFYAFRNYYFYSINITPVNRIYKFRKQMQQEFMDKMKSVAHVVRKEDALDLPEQTHVIRNVKLSDAELKAYNTLENDFILQVENDVVLAETALTEIMKLRQLTSGFCYTMNGETYQTGTSKLNELKDLLTEIGNHQVIIWANFKQEIQLLLNELPNSAAIWSGTPDRDAVIKDFQQGKIKYLIANPQSAAHGLTFVNCQYAVYYSLNYSYELQKQSQDRIHRAGQTKPVTYYYLIADNTIDGVIYKAVGNKADLSTSILNYLKDGKNETRTNKTHALATA